MGTLNPKTFESGEFCRVNDFLSNPDIFPSANPECSSTGLVLPFTHKWTNPEFKVGTLNPKTFESGEFCRVNDFLSNPDIFPSANPECFSTGLIGFAVYTQVDESGI